MNLPDQKKYTEKISDNNNIFKIMCDESLISIYIIQDKLIKYVNKQASILCGYSLDEMHAWDLEEYLNVIHPEDLPFVMEQGRKKQEGNKSDIIERHSYRIITKLGKIKWVDNFSKTIYYDGKPANLVYLIDITKNKKSEDIFQKAFQLSPDIRAISRIKDSTIIDINDIFLKTIDISKEEIIGQKPLFLYKNPEDRIKFLEELNEKGRVTDFKLEFLTSKKENRVGICSSEMIEIGGEKCLYTNVRDITERKQTEENLKKTEQKYRDLIENIPGAVWETQSDGKTTFVSPNIEEMTGYSIEEILTNKISWFDMIHKEDLQTVQNAFDLLFLEGKKFDIEYRLLKNDGTLIWLHDRAWSTYSKEGIDYVRGIASDITERKKAEEELQKTMVKYKILINNILAHLTLYTLDGIILLMNDSAANSLGYSTEEVIGKSLFDLFPEQTSIFKERIEQIKQSKKGLIVEDSIKFFQGIEWFTSNLQPVLDEMKNVFAIQVISQNITENKIAREKLRDSEYRFRTLVESSPDFIYIADLNGIIQYINRVDSQYNIDEVIGKEFYYFIEPEYHDNAKLTFEHIIKTGFPSGFDCKTVFPDKSIKYYKNRFIPLKLKGKITSFIGCITDITENKIAEEKLKESVEQFRTITEQSLFGIIIVQKTKIVYCNPEIAKIVGKSVEEVIGSSIMEFVKVINHRDYPMILKGIRGREKGNLKPSKFEFRVKNASKENIWLEQYSRPIHFKGKTAIQSVLIDITERKEAEEKIKSSLKEKEILLQEINHRVKNNMQIISSLLRLQSKNIDNKQYLEMCKESENRIASMGLVHEILYRSKNFSDIDFERYIRDLISSLYRSYGVDPNRIKFNIIAEKTNLKVNTAINCGLILNELITNSIKHAFPNNLAGEIQIFLNSISKKKVELIVIDNGVGLSEDVEFKKIGTLGLQLVKSLTENQLHGKIKINSNIGTKVIIKFDIK